MWASSAGEAGTTGAAGAGASGRLSAAEEEARWISGGASFAMVSPAPEDGIRRPLDGGCLSGNHEIGAPPYPSLGPGEGCVEPPRRERVRRKANLL